MALATAHFGTARVAAHSLRECNRAVPFYRAGLETDPAPAPGSEFWTLIQIRKRDQGDQPTDCSDLRLICNAILLFWVLCVSGKTDPAVVAMCIR